MTNKKNLLKILFAILALLFFLLGIDFSQNQPAQPNLPPILSPNLPELKKVQTVQVIDGDTIRVRDLQTGKIFRVRYLGIDTPELEGPDYQICFGSEAKEKNEELVQDKKLLLEFDQDLYDRFGRTLAYVYTLDDLGEKDIFVNLELLREGYARFYLDKQNTLWQDELAEAALSAHEDFLGLWGSCGEDQFDGKCLIKGNVDRLGQKYYHLPGDKYYSQTKINLLKEDQWLCTIEEAQAKNFQRAIH
jgi:micrococcal nuclease